MYWSQESLSSLATERPWQAEELSPFRKASVGKGSSLVGRADGSMCNGAAPPGSVSEAGDEWKARVTFTKSGCVLHAEERRAPVSRSDSLNLLWQSVKTLFQTHSREKHT